MELYFIYVIPFSFCLILIQVEKKLTYICKECLCMFYKVEAIIPFPTNNLKQHYTKAKHIRLHRKYSFHCIFWSHVSTFWIPTLILFFIKKTYKNKNKRISSLLCSYNSFGVSYILVFTKDPRHSKIRYFGNHVMVQQHIARFQVPMNDFKSGILMKSPLAIPLIML